MKLIKITFLFLTPFLFSGCATLGVSLLYKKVTLPETQIVRNISYTQTGSDDNKNTLNLFLPKGKNWPTMIFVHGGGWDSGDKDLKVAGADVYGNIGRYFASQGVGTAVVNYHLLPDVDWKTQVMDVAKATSWVYKNIHKYGGDTKSIFLAGHSAGAQISTRVALDPSVLKSLGLSPKILCGVIPISGVAFNFMNEETYEYAKKEGLFEELFDAKELSPNLRIKLSPIFFTKESSPPFLILYASKDSKIIKRESKRLDLALKQAGAQRQLYMVPKQTHASMILALSRAHKFPASMMLVFMKTGECGTSITKAFNTSPTPPEKIIEPPTQKSDAALPKY